MTKEDEELLKKFQDYGRDYITFCIERDGVDEWRKIATDDGCKWFKDMLANANYPAFDPETELDVDDPYGFGYDNAVATAWETMWEAIE